jgi:hypothetical protein
LSSGGSLAVHVSKEGGTACALATEQKPATAAIVKGRGKPVEPKRPRPKDFIEQDGITKRFLDRV